MKKTLFLLLLATGFAANAQLTPSTGVNYVKFLKTPPTASPITSDYFLTLYRDSDKFMYKMPSSVLNPTLQNVLENGNTANLGFTLDSGTASTIITPDDFLSQFGDYSTEITAGQVYLGHGVNVNVSDSQKIVIGESVGSGSRTATVNKEAIIFSTEDDSETGSYSINQMILENSGNTTNISAAGISLIGGGSSEASLNIAESTGESVAITGTDGLALSTNSSGNFSSQIKNDLATSSGQIYNLPNKAPGTYTLATTADTGGVASVNGTANEVSVDNTDPANPIVGLPDDVIIQNNISAKSITIEGTTNLNTSLTGVLKATSGAVGVQTVDTTPTNGSSNLVDSNGVYDAIVSAVSGVGTVTSVTGTNGVTVASGTSTPVIGLGNITPITVNGITLSGTSTPTLSVTGTTSISGSNSGDETTASIKTKLGAATNSVDGYLTAADHASFVNKTIANTYTAGAKQTFSPNATSAGINIGAVSSTPSTLFGGDMFYNSTTGNVQYYDSVISSTRTLVTLSQTQTLSNKDLSSGTNTFPTFNQNTTGSAATLTTPRNINGVAFNGSSDITVTAAAGTLTGTTLNSTVVSSSLTSVGTISSGTWQGTQIGNAYGGAAGLTGLLKATSGTVSAATSNTDYVNPTSGVFANAFSITGGLTANYLRGDGSAANLVSAVIASAIATATATNTPITTGVSINTALWRLQGQINANLRYVGSFSGVGTATTTFTVTIGTTQANNTYKVNVTPTSSLSAALFYVTNKTTTTFDVVYLAGLTGTVTFDWVVFP